MGIHVFAVNLLPSYLHQDEEEDTSEIDDDLEDMITSDIQRANDQDDDEDNDSDSGEDAMVMQVGQMVGPPHTSSHARVC